MLSYDKDGNEKYIEVKTARGVLNNIFHISEKEVEFFGNIKINIIYIEFIILMSADLKNTKEAISREKLQATNYTYRLEKNNENM